MGVVPEFYTVQEIADILKISINTARLLSNTKGFPSLRFGHNIRIPKDEFQKWVSTYTGKEFCI